MLRMVLPVNEEFRSYVISSSVRQWREIFHDAARCETLASPSRLAPQQPMYPVT
jgi:hypothetical protein